MKKSEALLIVVMLIAIFLSVAVTLTKSGIINVMITTNIASAMVAEEASQAGLEVGLLDYKINGAPGSTKPLCADLDNPSSPSCSSKSAKDHYADVSISKDDNNFITITSIGHFGAVVKKHSLTQVIETWN